MNSSDKQLLVEAAIAAANHGLEKQALCILEAFADLISDPIDCQVCSSLVYFALDKRPQAIRALIGLEGPQAEGLRLLYLSTAEKADTHKICSLITGG
ncbi:DUF1039 domain-containing protein [Vibrio ostreicida]|uniref:DUF1039 domain-containing protein n=1 Tax=Vibrio ostreicida TaxID=526588 RepID=UPI003B5A955F